MLSGITGFVILCWNEWRSY